MPIYRNSLKAPLPIQMADGRSLSISPKSQFPVDARTESTPEFRRLKSRGLVVYVSADEVPSPVAPVVIPPVTEEEVAAIPPLQSPPRASGADSPGRTTEVASTDAHVPEGEPDAPAFGADEQSPRESATSDGSDQDQFKRQKRKDRSR